MEITNLGFLCGAIVCKLRSAHTKQPGAASGELQGNSEVQYYTNVCKTCARVGAAGVVRRLQRRCWRLLSWSWVPDAAGTA